MSCPCPCSSDKAVATGTRVFLCALGIAVGVMVICSLPELKRYIKISTM